MEFLQSLLDNSNTPIVTAFILGLLTAINPCPLATNITAIGYISKQIENPHQIFWRGILYTIGRTITYTLLGVILILVIKSGANIFSISSPISKYGELALAPTLILIGVIMLFGKKINLPSFGLNPSKKGVKKPNSWGAFFLGIFFALAFCPTSAFYYFGILIPMSATETAGFLLPLVYAIATGLPVVIVAWILAYSVSELGKFYNQIQVFQKWFSIIVALLFISIGLYYGVTIFL